MLEVTTRATFTNTELDDEALTTIVARSVLEAALGDREVHAGLDPDFHQSLFPGVSPGITLGPDPARGAPVRPVTVPRARNLAT